ncbi:hypothetical protein PstZobell_10319 [Stutzerimonas stutzeri ATCC 14405 = CCUG 16156]|nr:hypothetical protein PstZobell_10319 [Stutzerimonas stutzeri ATCC 14405 = CCUG 16156]
MNVRPSVGPQHALDIHSSLGACTCENLTYLAIDAALIEGDVRHLQFKQATYAVEFGLRPPLQCEGIIFKFLNVQSGESEILAEVFLKNGGGLPYLAFKDLQIFIYPL